MTDGRQVHVPQVVKGSAKVATSIQGLDALKQIVESTRDCIVVHEAESSKRTHIRAYAETEVARIKAAEVILKDYFDRVFAERRELYRELFERLDQALSQQDAQVLQTVVRGIVDIAQTSPLAQLQDLRAVRAALDDPDQVWDL